MPVKQLSAREEEVVDRHLSNAPLFGQLPTRVAQWTGLSSVHHPDTGRLWVYRDDTSKRQCLQELYFHASLSVASTLTCSHPLKFWDLRRHASPRELARVQGFPEECVLPRSRAVLLFGNAVAVPCAAHALRAATPDQSLCHIDLCAGIGGFTWAARATRPQVTTTYASEVHPAALASYEDNFPDVIPLGDATVVTEWPYCDLLTAGFPCQPFSNASSRAKRSAHTRRDFFQTVLDAVRGTRATYVVLENVPQVATVGRARWTTLTTALEDDGFSIASAVLNAHDFGLPQIRRRLYLIARRDGVCAELPPPPPTTRRTRLVDVLEL